jgi:K+-transporting ATPase ATPase C chain
VKRDLLVSVRLLAVFTLLLGLAYPAAVWAIGRVAFPRAAGGSFVVRGGRVVGSELVGQAVTSPGLFRPRPSAAGNGYDATASGGSNLGPTSRALAERVAAEVARARAENPGATGPVPADAVTASGSGLDPHVSPAFALWQVPRVARETGIPSPVLEELVARRTEGPFLGLFGEPRVNVLLLNLDVEARRPGPEGGGTPPR